MPNIIEITDFHAPELDPYARLTQNQLRNRLEPEKGIFIAESPKVIDRALAALSAAQCADGGFASWGAENAESTAQVVMALCALGIDPAADERFCKEGGSAVTALLGFRGGKGILSGGVVAIMIDWRVALVVWGGFLILAVLTRYVSLGSCWAGASFPFITWFVYRSVPVTVLAVIIGGLILYMHRGNIHRLLTGTENKFTLHKKS